ncbi:MAG: prepilin peptidase [Candidatus Ranarchaeia archaeon]
MFGIVLTILLFFGVGLGTITDIQKREVSDKIPVSVIIIGLIIRFIGSIYYSNYSFFILGIITGLGYFLFSYILTKMGYWGEGDAAIFTAIGVCWATIPIELEPIDFLFLNNTGIIFPISLLLNQLIIGAIFFAIYMGVMILIKREIRALLKGLNFSTKELLAIFILSIFYEFSIFLLALTRIINPILFLFGPLYFLFILTILKISILFDIHVFWKSIPLEDIRIGDKLKEPIKLENSQKIPEKRSGISKDELNKLKEMNLQGLIKSEVIIKYGIPGIPGMLMTLLFTLFFGDFTGYLVTLLIIF